MTPFSLAAWALRHHVSDEALAELQAGTAALVDPPAPPDGASEARVQSEVRLEAAQKGVYLFRNNVGALETEGGFIRFGLANDTAALNRRLKSHDLIGFRPRLIAPADVGHTIAQFTSRECKRRGWSFNPNDDRELAQQAWGTLVLSHGGDAAFTTGPGSL